MITLITRANSTESLEAEEFLKTQNVIFNSIKVDKNDTSSRFYRRKFPIFMLNDEIKGSYEELHNYVMNNNKKI